MLIFKSLSWLSLSSSNEKAALGFILLRHLTIFYNLAIGRHVLGAAST